MQTITGKISTKQRLYFSTFICFAQA